MIKIGINGFGRIGRRVLVAALNHGGFEIVGINDLTDNNTLAHLLKYDSVHGAFNGTVEATDDALIINGKTVPVTEIRDPAELPWKERNADIIMECTGLFRTKAAASKHLAAGAKKVILSAPAKDAIDFTVVMGVNDGDYKDSYNIISNASCTTNCLAPIAKVLNDSFGINHGLMTTIHSYTTSQAILDAPLSDLRRARAAALSMIPTTTGAAKAVTMVLPELAGKLNGMAIRVPTPNVSLVDLTVQVGREVTVDQVNAAMKEAANGPMKGFLQYVEEPLVSIDFNGNPHSSAFDAALTHVQAGTMVKVLSWYDNEYGYSSRMVDLAAMIGG